MGDVTGDTGGWLYHSTTDASCLPRHWIKVMWLREPGLLIQEVVSPPSPIFKTLILSLVSFPPKLCVDHFPSLPAVLTAATTGPSWPTRGLLSCPAHLASKDEKEVTLHLIRSLCDSSIPWNIWSPMIVNYHSCHGGYNKSTISGI